MVIGVQSNTAALIHVLQSSDQLDWYVIGNHGGADDDVTEVLARGPLDFVRRLVTPRSPAKETQRKA